MPGGADALASSQYAQASTIDDGKIVLAGFVPVRTGEHDLAVVVEHKAVDDVQVEPLIGARRAYLHREVQNAFIATRDDAMHLRCQFTARVLMREIPERGAAGMAGECRRADQIGRAHV